MRRNKKNIIITMAIGCVLVLGGCGNKMNSDESIPKNVEYEIDEDNKLTSVENLEVGKEEEGVGNQVNTLVSIETFKKYYTMEEGSVSDEYLSAFIERRGLTEEDLAKRNYDVMVKKLYDSDIVYEASIYTLISGEKVSDIENVELNDLTHIIMLNDLSVDGTDLKTAEYIVLDIEKQKLYVSHNDITSNYESAENSMAVEKEWMQECFTEIKNILTDDAMMTPDDETSSLLGWHLYFIKKDKKVAIFSGAMSTADTNIYEWYQKVLEQSDK